MATVKKKAQKAGPAGAAKGQLARLPVHKKAAPARLAGRGGESRVAVVSDFGDELEDLPEMALELVRINKLMAELQAEKDAYNKSIRELMQTVKADESWTVRDEGTEWVATYIVPKEGKKLMPELLIQAGVSVKQLNKGYKTIPAKKPYVQVRTKGENVGANEEHE